MGMRWLLLISLCSVALDVSAGQRIIGIDVRANGAIIELDGVVQYRSFRMRAPERLVLDLRDSSLGNRVVSVDARTGPLLRVRSAPRNQHDQRIVFDLRHAIVPRISAFDDGHGRYFIAIRFGSSGSNAGAETISVWPPAARAPSIGACSYPAAEGGFVVAVDAGHGGHDDGAIGPDGVREKDVALEIALRLQRMLAAAPGIHSFLLRDHDEFIGLRERYRRARACGADLLVSIHTDALPSANIRGASVYIYPPRSRPARRMLASNSVERLSDVLTGEETVSPRLAISLGGRAPGVASYAAAFYILAQLRATTPMLRNKVLRRHFTVLSSDIPSVLVETGFITHPEEERRLMDPGHQESIARAVFRGIENFTALRAQARFFANRTLHIAGIQGISRQWSRRHAISVDEFLSVNRRRSLVVRPDDIAHIPANVASIN